MSFLSKFHPNQRDERLVTEMNKIYTIGYHILTWGILADIFYGLMQASVASMADGSYSPNTFAYVSPIEFFVFFAAQIVCAIISTRKGILSTYRVANTEKFPSSYYLTISLLAGVATAVAATLIRAFAEFQQLGAGHIDWLIDSIMGFSIGVAVFVLCIIAFALSFRAAKKLGDRQLERLDSK